MARLGRGAFLALAVIFHFTYIFSIFDIYFVSPVVHGMRAFRVDHHQPPAKRLVLFVGDGLRADKAFQSFPDPTPDNPTAEDLVPRPLAPFLRSRVLEHGTFGVSHTRVPTESRPGHVALIAGLYEDVSAVTTGWKLNPVDFDSVFNRSVHTWSWGSPDILPMFREGAVPGRVDADQYGAEAEDYSQDATQLDIWVFDKVKAMFAEARSNSTLNAMLRQEKVVFFLHLLGLDTSGHAHRPYSREYLNNIKVVDKGVSEIYQLLQDFYADDDTAYVFTADHGMHDLGSHGDGHPDNTRTPLIAWGAGLAKPVTVSTGIAPGHADNFSYDWGLQHVQRHDVEQADVAALMTYLVGLEFPVNSVGLLPISYLDATPEQKAHALLTNVKEVLEMYKVKEAEKQRTELRYRPYAAFAGQGRSVDTRIQQIEKILANHHYTKAIGLSHELMVDGLQGLRYLQTYDWLFLRVLITLGYFGWIAYGITTVIDLHVLHGSIEAQRSTTSTIAFSSILVLLYASFIVSSSKLNYYIYAFFPVFFWEEVWARRNSFQKGVKVLFGKASSFPIFETLAYIGVLEARVQAYFHRWVLTVCFLLGAIWPLSYGAEYVYRNPQLTFSWIFGCLGLSIFPLLAVVRTESIAQIVFGGALCFAAGLFYLVFEHHITSQSRTGSKNPSLSSVSRSIMGVQLGVLLLSIFSTAYSARSLQNKQGLPLGNQIINWLCLISSLVLPFVHRVAPNNHYLHRLVVIFLTFAPSFVILTISYEGIFYFAFSCILLIWIRLEQSVYTFTAATNAKSKPPSPLTTTATTPTDMIPNSDHQTRTTRALTPADLRSSLFFLFLLQSAFFSTGNVASVSSFSLDAVYRLIPIFDPFSQGALLLVKLIIPFALISAALGILNRRLGLQSSALFMVVMAVSDVMVVNFFWMVSDEGSWLEIGTTISHFVIGSLLSVWVAGLEGLSEVLIGGVEVEGVSLEKGVNGHGGPVKRPAGQEID